MEGLGQDYNYMEDPSAAANPTAPSPDSAGSGSDDDDDDDLLLQPATITQPTPPTPSTDDAPIHVNGADPLGSNDLDDLDGAPLDVTDDFLADYLDPNPATLADALGDRWEVDAANVPVAVGCYVACCYPAVGWEIGQVKKRLRRRETGWFDIRYPDPDHDGSFVMWSGRLYAGNRFGQGEDGTLIGPEVYGKWTVVKTK